MPSSRDVQLALQEQQNHTQPRMRGIFALLGNGAGVVVVPNMDGYHYIRLHGDASMLQRAWNDRTADIENLQVEVEITPRRTGGQANYQVLGRWQASGLWDAGAFPNDPYLPGHSAAQEWNPASVGRDPLTVYQQAMGMLRPQPTETASMTVYVLAGAVGQSSFLGGYSPAIVAPVTGRRIDLLYWAESDNALHVRAGAVAPGIYDLAVAPAAALGEIPLAEITVSASTTSLGWANLKDVRPFLSLPIPAATLLAVGTSLPSCGA